MPTAIDKKTHFLLNHLFFTLQLTTKFISEIIKEPQRKPDWFTEGIRSLLLKIKTKYTKIHKKKKRKKLLTHQIPSDDI